MVKIDAVETTYIINVEKMNFKVIHRHPKDKPKNTKNIEKRLYEVFKKYENSPDEKDGGVQHEHLHDRI